MNQKKQNNFSKAVGEFADGLTLPIYLQLFGLVLILPFCVFWFKIKKRKANKK